jgi:hypothetical protein
VAREESRPRLRACRRSRLAGLLNPARRAPAPPPPPRPASQVFGGARGPVADALNLNAGYALAACQVAADPREGVAMAQEAQRAGAAARVLERWVTLSQAEAAAEAAAGGGGGEKVAATA